MSLTRKGVTKEATWLLTTRVAAAARNLPEAGSSPPAGEPPLWTEYLTYDEAYNLVGVQRLNPQTGQWWDVSFDRPASAPDDDAGPAGEGRWTIAWGDDDDPDGPPPDDHAAAAVGPMELPPAPCPACKGTGSIPLLTSLRPCERCGGTGKAAG